MKTVIYARYSSHSQTEQSIEGQLRDCYEYARKNGLVVVGEYIDRALTGTSDERPEFQRMLADAETGAFQAVLTWKTDRFARNRYDSTVYKAKLKKCGVKIIYAKENIPDGPEGIILESLLEGLAEYYSAELRVKIKRGLRESALKCKYLGGIMALGYTHDADNNYVLDPVTAPVVLDIFKKYAADVPIADIIRELNDAGYRTARGGLFNKNSLRRVLVNKKYIGTYACGDVEIAGGIPAIVPEDLFLVVQGKVANVKGGGRRQRVKYLLTDKLFCGSCGAAMIGESGTGRSGELFSYYKCKNRKIKKCDCDVVRKDWLEGLVVQETVNRVLAPDVIDVIATRCVEVQLAEAALPTEADAVKKQISAVQKSINNIMRAIEAGVFTETTKMRLQELEAQKEKLEYTLSLVSVRPPVVDKDQIIYMLSRFLDKDYSSEKARAELINSFVSRVVYYPDKIDIFYNLLENSKAPLCSSISRSGGANVTLDEHLTVFSSFVLLSVLFNKK